MSTTTSPEAVRKLLDNMQTDLRSLSMECKKKFPPVKEVRGFSPHTAFSIYPRGPENPPPSSGCPCGVHGLGSDDGNPNP